MDTGGKAGPQRDNMLYYYITSGLTNRTASILKMKRTFRYAIILIAAIALQGCVEETGFVPLFNGRDLSGWVNVNGLPCVWAGKRRMRRMHSLRKHCGNL